MKLGFSLIELITVLALISILSVVSASVYHEHLIRGRRLYIVATLLDIAGRLEKYYVEHGSYEGATATNLAIDDAQSHGFYRITITAQATWYTVTATPLGPQTHDGACGVLTIDQAGNKSATGSSEGLACWL